MQEQEQRGDSLAQNWIPRKGYICFKILVIIVDLDLYVSPSIKSICIKDKYLILQVVNSK
jgi:hypothetical protein